MGAAVERVAALPAALVYLTAMYPDTIGHMMASGGPEATQATASILFDEGTTAEKMILKRDVAAQVLYQDCSAADTEWAISQLVPESGRIGTAVPLARTPERWGAVPKYYIETVHDLTIPIDVQRKMRGSDPFRAVFTLESGHSPFLNQPFRLAIMLDRISQQVEIESVSAPQTVTALP